MELGLTEQNKELLKSIWPLLVVIILFIVVGKIAVSQITAISTQVKDAKKSQTVLTTKLNTLKSTASITESGSEVALTALPKSNPAIMIMSQLKNISSQYPVVISNIRSTFADNNSSNLMFVSTAFDLSGKPEDIMSFIKAIDNIAPITVIQKISITSNVDFYTANIVAQTYYTPLPSTIPSITQPVNDLTAAEKDLLNKLSALSQPMVIPQANTSGDTSINPNPFGI